MTVEALWHLMGGHASGWMPTTVRHEGDVHWFLSRWIQPPLAAIPVRIVIDPTAKQFKTTPLYHLGHGRGFLTKRPSRRARELMDKMLWQSATKEKR